MTYELIPHDSRKSFYGKAKVTIDENGTKTLYSYDTPIMQQDASGNYKKLWQGWTATTGRHIAAFCGMNKAEFMKL